MVLRQKEAPQGRRGLVRLLLRHIMRTIERRAADVDRPLAPCRQYVEISTDQPLCAPEQEQRRLNALFQIGFVVNEVDRRGGAIVLAARMDCLGGPEAAAILGN